MDDISEDLLHWHCPTKDVGFKKTADEEYTCQSFVSNIEECYLSMSWLL